MIHRRPYLAALLLLAPVMAACSTPELPPCPPIYILGDAGKLTKFRAGAGRDLTDVEFQAEIQGFQGSCKYDDKGAVVDLQVSFSVERGPANGDRKADFAYFTAIPYFYPSADAKAVFPVSVAFPTGQNRMRLNDEEITLRIPVKDKELIDKYEIYLGFQTNSDELDFNRRERESK